MAGAEVGAEQVGPYGAVPKPPQGKWCARMPQPQFVGIDAVPVAGFTRRQQKQDRRPVARFLAEGLAVVPALRVGCEAQGGDDVRGREAGIAEIRQRKWSFRVRKSASVVASRARRNGLQASSSARREGRVGSPAARLARTCCS